MKRAFIVHRWDGSPSDDWYPWLQQELTAKGYQVQVPAMPNPSSPKIDEWVARLKLLIGYPNKHTFLIGHSIGCQTILRYLAMLDQKQVGGIVLVAPWFNLNGLETPEEKAIAKPWLKTPIDYGKVLAATRKTTAIFSSNDPSVPLSDAELFKSRLFANVIIEENKGHYTSQEGITQVPIILKELAIMAQ